METLLLGRIEVCISAADGKVPSPVKRVLRRGAMKIVKVQNERIIGHSC
jgi:hypothetical protein